uniref:Solute carrier family 12 member 9 n=1 Tax=Angiostrongylus cantonensis TaxID=6313 RepID=A0A158P8J2_ANGCA
MTVVQLAMAYAIVMLTVLSLCAISSNGAVEGGGVYYMISRSLGPEFGGAIGVLLFVANIFSCALYISGFTEALLNNLGNGQFPDSPAWRFLYCVLVSSVLFILCLLGAGIFAKTALFTFVLISICYSTWLFSLIFDGPMEIPIPKVNTPAYRVRENASDPDSPLVVQLNQTLTANYTGIFSFRTLGENMFTNYTMDYTTERPTDFALMFAIIFSGVTGLMAGANMSGELARPSVSIPRGTVQAVFTTLFVYIMTAFLMAATSSRYLLQNDYTVMMDTNFQRWFILIGIFSTTLFSSMSNLIGSSRVLNRLSHDKLFGCLLRPAKIEIGDRNPVVSVVITWLCVVGVFLIGAMNKIAKLTSIFFLLSYMGVNIACLALELTSAPNFRPTFKYFSWWTCALGVVSTSTMMLVVDASMSAIGVIVLMSLIMVLHYQAPAISSGSISQALIYHQVRKYLLLLDVRKEHVKYWRPQILLLVSRPSSACPLMDFVNDLKKSGLYVVGHVQKGDLDANGAVDPLHQIRSYWVFMKLHQSMQPCRFSLLLCELGRTFVLYICKLIDFNSQESQLLKDLRYSKIDRAAVVEYFTAKDYMPKELSGNLERLTPSEYVNVLKDVLYMTKSLCVARHFHKHDKESLSQSWNQKRFIDVWPVDLQKPVETGLGWDNSSLFLLQLACILSMSSRWRSHSRLRVFICVNSLQDMHRRDRQLKQMLDMLRIKAESIVVPWDHVVCHFPQISGPFANTQRPAIDLPGAYLSAFNDMIKRYSEEAAITLLNLPLPPDDANKHADRYLDQIRCLTDALPPTLMVHGVSSVISTAL